MAAYEEIATVSDPAQAGRRTSLAPAPKKGTSKLKQKEHITALAFISVKYVGLFIFTLLPLLLALLYGFTDYTGADTGKPFFSQLDKLWLGFGNYKALFTSLTYRKPFLNAIKNNLIFLISVPLGIFFGLIVAFLLSQGRKVYGSKIIRMLIYVPVVSSAVAMAIIWQYIFDNEYGIINQVLGVNIPWMTNASWLKVAIIIKTVWGSLGRTMILCIAGLMAVSKDYYEAAEIDGANRFTQFFKISIPLISPTLFYLLCTGVIGNLQSYVDSEVFANKHSGGQTIVYFIWEYGIRKGLYGLASAASFVLSIGIMLITFAQFKISDKWVYSE